MPHYWVGQRVSSLWLLSGPTTFNSYTWRETRLWTLTSFWTALASTVLTDCLLLPPLSQTSFYWGPSWCFHPYVCWLSDRSSLLRVSTVLALVDRSLLRASPPLFLTPPRPSVFPSLLLPSWYPLPPLYSLSNLRIPCYCFLGLHLWLLSLLPLHTVTHLLTVPMPLCSTSLCGFQTRATTAYWISSLACVWDTSTPERPSWTPHVFSPNPHCTSPCFAQNPE